MTQEKFRQMLSSHGAEVVNQSLSTTQLKNLSHFGYGVKGFILSMIETSIELTQGEVTGDEIMQILDFGKEMQLSPTELLPEVEQVIHDLHHQYRLVLITKGDLFDQETKIAKSGLADYFEGVEIVSDKKPHIYEKILTRYRVDSSRFLMIGNSMRSDIVPVVQIGAHALHIPYLSTWEHEQDHPPIDPEHYTELEHINQVMGWLDQFKKEHPENHD